MKKLLEYKVFDILKDKENSDFLRKVKNENPDEYAKFISFVGNKGLEFAKKKYEPYDPEYIKLQKEKEKQKALEIKRKKTKEYKEGLKKFILKRFEPQINEVEDILFDSELYKFEYNIKTDPNIKRYLDIFHVKSRYKNIFSSHYLKDPKKLNFDYNMNIDELSFNYKVSNTYKTESETRRMITIYQFYSQKVKKLTYSIILRFPRILSKIDKGKEYDFFLFREKAISKLEMSTIDKNVIYKIIEKFSEILSEEYYENWYKEWEFDQNIKKYNL